MDPAAESAAPARPQVRKRAWWQWALGIGLIGFAVFSLFVRGVGRYRPEWFAFDETIDPIPLKVPAELKEAATVPAQSGEYAGHNILFITLDTTRADRLGCYGNANIKTPHMDALAKSGVMFSRAISPNPTTLPSHSCMMTGLFPLNHGARANGVFRLGDEKLTLAEMLTEKGYATAAAVSAFVLDSRYGLNQGFMAYDDKVADYLEPMKARDPERRGDKTTDVALDWLEKNATGEKPFFYWIHYFDPHQPYNPPAEFATEYADVLYDGEIAFVDTQIGRLLKFLDRKGITDNTLVVVVGDHGQGLGQHDEMTHGFVLYDATLHVPFIMACGDRLGGGVHVPKMVCTVDIMPTVLTMLGMESPSGIDGVDLTKATDPERVLFLDTLEGFLGYGMAPLLGACNQKFKYVWAPEQELYDLSADPYENKNIASQNAATLQALEKRLKGFFGEDLAKASQVQPTETLSQEDYRQLAALGYIGEGVSSIPASGELPDPKSMMPIVRRAEVALAGLAMGKPDHSIAALNHIIDDYPDFYIGHKWLADCYLQKKDMGMARETLKRCVEVHPNVPYPYIILARLALYFKDLEEAIIWYEDALKISPQHFTALSELGGLLLDMGRELPKATELLTMAYKMRPDDQLLVEHTAAAMTKMNRAPEAIDMLTEQLKLNSNLPATRNALARLLLDARRCPEAIAVLREGVALRPEQNELVHNLAYCIVLCSEQSKLPPMEATLIMEKLCQRTEYKVPEYLRTLAMVYAGFGRFDEAITVAEQAHRIAVESSKPGLAKILEVTIAKYRNDKAVGPTAGDKPGNPTSQPKSEGPAGAAP